MSMHKISFTSLQDLAGTKPTAWHQLLEAGKLVEGNCYLLIDPEVEAKILRGETISQMAAPVTRGQEEINLIQDICAGCPWNIDWLCEHPGCPVCQQRAAGGLKQKLTDLTFHCPAHKWK